MSYLYMSTFETPNFTFQAFGHRKDQAEGALIQAWKKHANNDPDTEKYLFEYWGDVETRKIQAGEVWRDGQIFTTQS